MRCIVQDQTYWAWSVCDQIVLDVMWIHWELDRIIMSKIRWPDCKIWQICITGCIFCKIRHTEHVLFVIKTSWTFCEFIGSLPESLWARSDILITRSAQICSTGAVLCKIKHTEEDLCMIKTSWTLCEFIGSLTELLWARSDDLIARSDRSASQDVYFARSDVLSMICLWSKRPRRYVNSLGACLNHYTQDRTSWL